MMFWVLMLTLFGGLLATFGRALPTRLPARTLAIQGLLGFGTLAFIIGLTLYSWRRYRQSTVALEWLQQGRATRR